MTIPSGTAKWAWSFRGSDIARVPGAVQPDNSAPLIRDFFPHSASKTIPGLQRTATSAFTRAFARYGAALRPGKAA